MNFRQTTSVSATQPKYNDSFCFLSHADGVPTCLCSNVCVCVCECVFVSLNPYMYLCLYMRKNICAYVCVCVRERVLTIYSRLPEAVCRPHLAIWNSIMETRSGTDGHILCRPYSQWSTSSCLKGSTHKPEEPINQRKVHRLHPLGRGEQISCCEPIQFLKVDILTTNVGVADWKWTQKHRGVFGNSRLRKLLIFHRAVVMTMRWK